MQIYLYKNPSKKLYNISQLVSSFTWSGTIEQAIRTFQFNILNSPYDTELQNTIPSIAIGDIVELYMDNDSEFPNYLLFRGKVAKTTKSSNKGVVNYICYDFLHALSKSSVFKTYSGTPESIARSIAEFYGLTIQFIKETGVNIGTVTFDDKTYIEIINECYKKAGETTGLNYYIYMDGWGFCIDEEGHTKSKIQLNDKSNILQSTFEESIDNLVNYVTIYDDEDNFVGNVSDDESIKRYGVYSKVYHVEKYVDRMVGARKQLHGVDTTVHFETLGQITWWSGRMVQIWDEGLKLAGNFIITSDTHQWSGGRYTCDLQLRFHSLADAPVSPTYE